LSGELNQPSLLMSFPLLSYKLTFLQILVLLGQIVVESVVDSRLVQILKRFGGSFHRLCHSHLAVVTPFLRVYSARDGLATSPLSHFIKGFLQDFVPLPSKLLGTPLCRFRFRDNVSMCPSCLVCETQKKFSFSATGFFFLYAHPE
jgi:hypothetical protein